MSKDKLEKYILDNLTEFNTAKAPENVWLKISDGLENKKQKTPIWYFISGMAATLLLMIVALCGYYIGKDQSAITTSEIAFQEYQQLEESYIRQVNQKMQLLEGNISDQSVEEDLIQLDAVYQELKAELVKNHHGNTDAVIDALIKNHQTKINLLELILERQLESKNDTDEHIKI